METTMNFQELTFFKESIKQGIPSVLPQAKPYPADANRAPKRKDILSVDEKQLAVRNALRYFPKEWHQELATEFAQELKDSANNGDIYEIFLKTHYRLQKVVPDQVPKFRSALTQKLSLRNIFTPGEIPSSKYQSMQAGYLCGTVRT